jgi:catechol 2,3-dioxygenase-like lactoylglutathione lyase family enzyme
MPFKFSNCLCMQVPDIDRVVSFYHRILGLKVTFREKDSAELEAGPFRLFLDRGTQMGPVMEFLVPDLAKAKEELLQADCEIIRCNEEEEGCYIRDPFGFILNLYEQPEAFQR